MAKGVSATGILVERPDPRVIESMRVKSWPIWEKEPSTFDWSYDQTETCYFIEGNVTVKTPAGEVSFGKGDLVTFPRGTSCTWHVKKAVRKHYRFE